MKLRRLNIVIVLFVFLLATLTVVADTEEFTPSEASVEAADAISQADEDMQDMIDAGFNVIRVNDALEELKQLYEAQLTLEKSSGRASYGLILQKTTAINDIKDNAFKATDEVKALEARIAAIPLGIDKVEIDELFERAKQEIEDERFETCLDVVEETYEKISEIESAQARLRVMYNAATYGIRTFIVNNWKTLIVILTAIILLFFFGHKRFLVYRLKKRLERLNLEKQLLQKLISKAQREYFERKSLSEGGYRIKIKKFAELTRDIDRQIPLISEEIERARGTIKKKTGKEKKKKKGIKKEVHRVIKKIEKEVRKKKKAEMDL